MLGCQRILCDLRKIRRRCAYGVAMLTYGCFVGCVLADLCLFLLLEKTFLSCSKLWWKVQLSNRRRPVYAELRLFRAKLIYLIYSQFMCEIAHTCTVAFKLAQSGTSIKYVITVFFFTYRAIQLAAENILKQDRHKRESKL